MAKMTAQQKDERKFYLQMLQDAQGKIFSFPETGVTIVVIPAIIGNTNSRFAHISIAVCDMRDDKFKRKVGEYGALKRMYDYCEHIAVRVGGRSFAKIAEDMHYGITGQES